jgi:hypothetical protein
MFGVVLTVALFITYEPLPLWSPKPVQVLGEFLHSPRYAQDSSLWWIEGLPGRCWVNVFALLNAPE